MQTLASGESSERRNNWWPLGWNPRNLTTSPILKPPSGKIWNILTWTISVGRLRQTEKTLERSPDGSLKRQILIGCRKQNPLESFPVYRHEFTWLVMPQSPWKPVQTFTCDWRNTELTNTHIYDRKIPITPDIGGILRNKIMKMITKQSSIMGQNLGLFWDPPKLTQSRQNSPISAWTFPEIGAKNDQHLKNWRIGTLDKISTKMCSQENDYAIITMCIYWK